MFPFVFDLTNAGGTEKYSFFKFSFKGEEGYILYNKRNKSIKYGLGMASGPKTAYRRIIPAASFGNRFYAVCNTENNGLQRLNVGVPDIKFRLDSANQNPFLISYSLKN